MKLEKSIWGDDDFSEMGWHDSKIWGFLPDTEKWEYLVDLDYIFNWVHNIWCIPQVKYVQTPSRGRRSLSVRSCGSKTVAGFGLEKASIMAVKYNGGFFITGSAFETCFGCDR